MEDRYCILRDALNHITYKPNYKFVVLNDRFDAVRSGWMKIQLQHDGVDSDDFKSIVVLCREPFYFKVSGCIEGLIKRAYEEIVRSELHEAGEFYRYKGKAFWHPHVTHNWSVSI